MFSDEIRAEKEPIILSRFEKNLITHHKPISNFP